MDPKVGERRGERREGENRGFKGEAGLSSTGGILSVKGFCKEEVVAAKGGDLGEVFATWGSKAYWGTSE